MGANRRAILKSWPDTAKPLIQLERSTGTLNHLIASDCRLSAGPLWLFRIGSDGLAREILGKIVRPGQDYVVVTTGAAPEPDLMLRACDVSCTGVKSFRIAVPPRVSAAETAWLNKVGLAVARTIRVWPAGLPGRGWDGEGHVEVLTTESAAFGIVHDHPIESYSIRLNGGEQTILEAGGVGYPTFIRLPQLAPGTHTLIVKSTRDPSQFAQPISPEAEGFLLLSVREPEPWIPGRAAHHGLIVTIDPNDFDLAALWEDRVSVSVIGPDSHHVVCRIELSGPRGEQLLSENICEPMALPLTAETWSRTFKRFIGRTDVASRYLEATSGRLVISAEELGEYAAGFEHEALPLRWVLTGREDKILVRLIDDTGRETGEPDCAFFPLQKPLQAEAVPTVDALAGRASEIPGGLFVAQYGNYQDRIVVSAGLAGSGLQGLGVAPDFSEIADGSISVAEACRVLELWSGARLVGFLPDIRLQQVVDGLISAIFAKLCGQEWAKAEKALLDGLDTQRSFDALQRSVDRSNGFASVLRRDYAQLNRDFPAGADWFADLAVRYGVCAERKVSKFALRMASQPQRIPTVYGDSLELLVSRTAETPAILRGARLLALLAANEDGVLPMKMLPSWTWS
jgi:hypothetical protein